MRFAQRSIGLSWVHLPIQLQFSLSHSRAALCQPPFTLTSTSASGVFVALCALTACSITRLKAGGTKQPSTGRSRHLRALHCSVKAVSTLDDGSKRKGKKGFCVTWSVPAAVAHQSLLSLSQLVLKNTLTHRRRTRAFSKPEL